MSDSRSPEAVMEFLDYCKSKGLLKPKTAESRKAAVNQVLGILSEDEATDVAEIDLDSVMHRFHNLYPNRYTPDSLRTYKARVKNSIYDFLRFRENPMDFKPTAPLSSKSPLKRPPTKRPPASADNHRPQTVVATGSTQTFLSASTLPIPIRENLTILIHGLPFDLSQAEARKIANVILALAGTPSQ